MHGVHSQHFTVVDENAAGIVATDNRVLWIFLPMDEVLGDNQASRPGTSPFGIFVGVIDSVVASLVSNNLV
jgi:hypothetical protein